MKLKLDENLGRRVRRILDDAGHDVSTVHDQGLSGADDESVYEQCVAEERVLVTLDLDFADILRFPTRASGGVVIFRRRGPHSWEAMESLARELAVYLENESLVGALWIVESGRLRVRDQNRG